MLNKYLAYIAGLLILFSLFGLYCYDKGKKSVKVQTITRIETKTEQKIEYVDRVTTRTIKGDTVTETIHEKGKTETKIVEVEKEKPVKQELTRYAISAFVSYSPTTFDRAWHAQAGARLGNLPAFIELGATSKKEALLGLRWEF